MPEPVYTELGMDIMAPETISTASLVTPSLGLYVYPPIFARQRLCKNVTAATNINATIKERMNPLFSLQSVIIKGK
jgi:hypothetical protein